jgi:hypothetical protein
MSWMMRGWLNNYGSKLFPNKNFNIDKGYNYDSPKLLDKNLFNED